MEKSVFGVIATLFVIIGTFPRRWLIVAGDFLGRLLFGANRKHRTIAVNNLTRAFGHEMNTREIEILARQVFKNLGQIIFEIAWSARLKRNDFTKHFSIHGIEDYRAAGKKGRGVLLLTIHVGNWELLPIVGAMGGLPVDIVYRPLDFVPLNDYFLRLRSRFGAGMIPTTRSMRKILKSLNSGRSVALLMDQNFDCHEGVFVDFFGHRACTNKGMALLARKTGAPVVPVFLVREKERFRAEFGAEIPWIKTGDKTNDIESNTECYNKVIEDFIRRYPDQWFWVHQRWKTKPFHPWPRVY